MSQPATLAREISPPRRRKRNREESSCAAHADASDARATDGPPSLAAVEAGQAEVRDHLAYFAAHLAEASRDEPKQPRISMEIFKQLYERNRHRNGHHFVVHQHNHPIAGVHYDLRLQFSDSSSVSFALPYGLPGNPNTQRPARMAIETRVHNLWNNLMESASHATGSLLIWDTGEYEVLDRYTKEVQTDDDLSDGSEIGVDGNEVRKPQNERLVEAFQSAYIRLRLNGTRLPKNYTVTLRLPSSNRTSKQPRPPQRKRRRTHHSLSSLRDTPTPTDTESDTEAAANTSSPATPASNSDDVALATASGDEDEVTALIRSNNAYIGANNSIGSVHQRRWYLTLDKPSSGFMQVKSGREKGKWIRDGGGGFEPFFVEGAHMERSVVTGRLSEELMSDEGVQRFIARKMWRPILE